MVDERCLWPGCVLPRKPDHSIHEPEGVPPFTLRNLIRRILGRL